MESYLEEKVKIKNYGTEISKSLKVFYNPKMKLNRDLTLLFIKSYFKKPIIFCDPMAASGIREIRFLKSIPEMFKKMIISDISNTAISDIYANFEKNKIHLDQKVIEIERQNAINTIAKRYYDFIEIDPFGSPIPFLDVAIQRIRHNGIISVTATDTAALCGSSSKTAFRRYGIKIFKTFSYKEFGLRNLISYMIRETAKYDKIAKPLLAYASEHYYKIFFKINDSKTQANLILSRLAFIDYCNKTQNLKITPLEDKEGLIGKIYIGLLYDKKLISQMIENLDILKESKTAEKLLKTILSEVENVGYYNIHKLQKNLKISVEKSFETIIDEIKKKNFSASRTHCDNLGIKTDIPIEMLERILSNK